MELAYNELSNSPLSANKYLANEKMGCFVQTYAKARNKGFRWIRFPYQLHEINLAEGYSIHQWLSETDQRNLKDLLLAAKRYPFIDDNDEAAIGEYLRNRYFFENTANNIARTECIGFDLPLNFRTHS